MWQGRAAGLVALIAGLFLIFAQFLWTTGDESGLAFLPAPAAGALVFLLGLFGLSLSVLGIWAMLRKGETRGRKVDDQQQGGE